MSTEIAAQLQGLSDTEAQTRRAKGLGNPARPPTSRTYREIISENVLTPINAALFFLGIALALVGRPTDAIVSSLVIFFNVLVSVIQEIRAKRTLDRIALLTRPQAIVLRDGHERQVSPEDLVVGDVLKVGPGDQIVLDGKVIAGKMAVDESQLTGESNLIAKAVGAPVYSGSFCVSGTTFFVVEKVGAASLANQITAGARAFRRVLTPLQKQVYLVIRIMFLIAGYLAFLIIINGIVNDLRLAQGIQELTLVAGLVPNGLFLSISIAYALGAVRIIRHGVLVQQANAIESLSNVNVLCLDKTGTLTTNRLKIHALHPLAASETELLRALGVMAASMSSGNKTSEAIAAAFPAEKITGVEIPFSSARKWSAIAFASGNLPGTFALGAPEMIHPYLRAQDAEWQTIVTTERTLADQGLRVLLFAHHPATTLDDQGDASRLPAGMTPLGLVSVSDELRPEAREALAAFRKAGVEPKIISGDNPETVAALAKQAGLGQDIKLVSGLELEAMDDAAFRSAAISATIFGRITPQQKERLVKTLREAGYYVAMIGDGVNDVLALKRANLGVAMQGGAQAARSVADLVLMTDSFASLAPAVGEGQRIRNGMQDILKLYITRIATMALVILSAMVIGEFPLELRQGSLITLFSVGIPATMIAVWAKPGAIPQDVLGKRLFRFILTPVIVTSLLSIVLFYGTLFLLIMQRPEFDLNLSADQLDVIYAAVRWNAQSALTTFLVLCGLLTVIFVEPPTKWWVGGDSLSGDKRPTFLVLGMLVVFVIILLLPPLRNVFAMTSLGWIEIGAVAVTTVVWLFLVRWLWRRRAFERFLGLKF